jgi:ATP/maltotriose-dependent transcriptional regulator MalT
MAALEPRRTGAWLVAEVWDVRAVPPTISPPMGAMPERDALVATKFHTPPPGFLPRPQLLARLAQGMGRGLTVVSTPAGFGKTTLLGAWARRTRGPTAWLSLDDGDNDPARFWRYVAAALDQVRPGVLELVDPLLRGPQPPLEAVTTTVINELTVLSASSAVTLILDDYHLIDTPAVHTSVGFLLDRLPLGLRLVLTSRADPPLPLARLRGRGQLAELRAADLRFTLAETAAFLREATGIDLPPESVAKLQDRTEGWAVGVQLAALSLQGHPDPADFVASFAGSHRYVLDYLTQEVLARQPEQLVGFLLETAILERLSGPLCDAVTGRTDSQQVLEQVEQANLFVVPLDDVRGWWRYHHLFADLLRARLEHTRPQRVPELHRAAAAWHEMHGFADEAVRHALAAGDVGSATRLVEQNVEALLRRSEGATLGRWLSALPAESVSSRARLCLAQAVAAVVGSQVEAVEPLLTAAERALAASGKEPYQPSVGRALSVLTNVPAAIAFLHADLERLRGDSARAVAYDQEALKHLERSDWLLGSHVAWNLAVADWMSGRPQQAEQALAEVVAARRAAGEGYLAMRVAYDLGQVQRAQGRLGAALATYRQGMEATGGASAQLPHVGMAHIGMADVLYERDELPAAKWHATQGVAFCQQLAYTQPLATGLGILARIRQAEGDPAGALEAIGQAQRIPLSAQVVPLHNPVPVWRARLLLVNREVAEVAGWVDERGIGVIDESGYPREAEYLLLARLLLAQQKPDQAIALLARLHTQAEAQERLGSVVEVQALEALALAASGDQAAALIALAEALAAAAPEGYVRVFVDEGAPMARLLGRLATAGRAGQGVSSAAVPLPYLSRLMHAFEPGAALHHVPRTTREAPGGAELVEPLTDRELQVLRLIAAGKSNQQIADELVVVVDTVKKHVGHILDKLEATNRTQAAARARALGLLR